MKNHFNNWVETRKTLGKNDDDPAVKKRAKKLDDLRLGKLKLEKRISANNTIINGKYR